MDEEDVAFFKTQGLEFKSVIATGGYGVVYLMYSYKYCMNFAVKTIPKEMFKESELDCLKMIDDPHIVNLYSFYNFDSFVYMLMEYCPNDLEKLRNSKQDISDEELSKYIKDAILGLKACHDRKIAHCDIKPSNFLIDKYGRVKISDFGMSTIYHDQPKSHTYKGTSVFMSPEILKRNEYNPLKADVWALGVTIYFMATGKYPFYSEDHRELQGMIKSGKYDESIIPDENLCLLIKRCLVVNPEERASINELCSMPYFMQCSNEIDPEMPRPRQTPANKNLSKRKSLISLQSMHTKRCTRSSSIQIINSLSKSSEKFKL